MLHHSLSCSDIVGHKGVFGINMNDACSVAAGQFVDPQAVELSRWLLQQRNGLAVYFSRQSKKRTAETMSHAADGGMDLMTDPSELGA